MAGLQPTAGLDREEALHAAISLDATFAVAVVVGILGVTGDVGVVSSVRLVSLSTDNTRNVFGPIMIREPVLLPRLGTVP